MKMGKIAWKGERVDSLNCKFVFAAEDVVKTTLKILDFDFGVSEVEQTITIEKYSKRC